jgi:DNA-binding XRE family transcriptional regulator
MMNERIKELRRRLGVTQKNFGEKIEISQKTINDYESGRVGVPKTSIKLICDNYNVNREWLETGEGEMFKPPIIPPSASFEELYEKYSKFTARHKKFIDGLVDYMIAYQKELREE